MKNLLLTVTFLFISLGTFAQSESVEDFAKEHLRSEDTKMSFSGSWLKLAALAADTDEEKQDLIQLGDEVKWLELYHFDKDKSGISRADFRSLQSSLAKEKFEEYMSVQNSDSDIQLVMKEKGGLIDGMVVLIDSDDGLLLMDLKGKIDLNNLQVLMDNIDIDFN